MKYCTECGHQLPNGAKFCAECGASVQVSAQSQRKTVYDGEIHKCPHCGEVLNSFQTNCPACGHEIRGVQGVSSVRQLAIKLEQLESRRTPQKRGNILSKAFGGGQLPSTDEQKIALIRTFAIPNTKEDVLEFIALAASNIDLKVYGLQAQSYQWLDPARRELSDAWLAKLEQADQKAEIMFGHTQEYISMRNVYEKKIKEIKKQKRKIVWLFIGLFGFLVFWIGLMFLLIGLTGGFS